MPAANRLYGLDGNDRLDGGVGDDKLYGGTGDDVYMVDDGDATVELAGEGTDLVDASVSHTLKANIENLALTEACRSPAPATRWPMSSPAMGASTGSTASKATTLDGHAGVDDSTEAMAVTCSTAASARTSCTAAPAMTFISSTITVTPPSSLPAKAPTWSARRSATRSKPISRICELTGSANLNGTGNGLANRLTGNSGDNVLSGLAGNDTLDGGGAAATR